MFAAGGRLAGRCDSKLPNEAVETLLEDRFAQHLSREQRGAVLHATTGQDLALIVGRAGAGKTRLTRAIAGAYREAGYAVRGAALGGKAAEGLSAEAGIEARTLAAYEYGWKEGRGELGSRDVLLVDEAGMVDVRQMRRVLEHARDRGAKVVLVGDPDQLKAIGPGDAFRGLIEEHGAARVDTIRRQADAWQREASEHLADGRIEPALAAYAERGAVQRYADPDQARDALVMAYFEDRYLAPDQSSLILAHRRGDVRRLNERIREVRRDAGELGAGVRLDGREFSAGDRVLFLRNDHAGRDVRTVEGAGTGVKNGTLGTLAVADRQRFRVRLDSGRTVEFDPRAYGRLDHGYAATVHKAQGITVDRAYVLAGRGFDRNLSYVALTRHRHQLRLYVDQETFASEDQLLRVMARQPRKDLARDYRATSGGAPALTADLSATDAWVPPTEPVSVELTAEGLEGLQGALGRLERFEDLSTRARELARARQALPYRGNLLDLNREIRALEQPPRGFQAELGRIFRQPEAARSAFERYVRDHGRVDGFSRLEQSPETFGRLRGRRLLGQPSGERAEALGAVRRLVLRGAKRRAKRLELRDGLEHAERYRAEAVSLASELATLGTDRSVPLGEVRDLASSLDLERLTGRLAPHHLETLRELNRVDRIHLEPLREALASFRSARKLRKPTVTLRRLASHVSTLARATPRSLLRRLAPPQLRILMSATSLAAAALKKLSAEPEDRDKTRRTVLRP